MGIVGRQRVAIAELILCDPNHMTTPDRTSEWPDSADFAVMPNSLKSAVKSREFASGDHLFRIGANPVSMFYVLSGEVRLLRSSVKGAEILLQRTRRGFIAKASMDASSYHCDAIAAERSTVLQFPLTVFRGAIEGDAAFRSAWISCLSREVRTALAQCERLSLKSATARVLHFLETEEENGILILTQTRKAWATELGLSHEALYRTLTRLEKEGIILVKDNIICMSRR